MCQPKAISYQSLKIWTNFAKIMNFCPIFQTIKASKKPRRKKPSYFLKLKTHQKYLVKNSVGWLKNSVYSGEIRFVRRKLVHLKPVIFVLYG